MKILKNILLNNNLKMVKKICLVVLLMFVFFISGVFGASSLTLTNPANNTYSNNLTQNFTTNISGNSGISNATLYIYNSTSNMLFYNETYTNFSTGKALLFDGSNDFISAGNSSNLNSVNVTVCAWINSRSGSISSYQGILAKRRPSYFPYGMNFNNVQFQVYGSGSVGIAKFAYNVSANTWVHVCGIIDTSGISLFVNGSLFGKNTTLNNGSFTDIAPLYIGSSNGSIEFFNGSIDEVLIFNRSLNSTEISQLYNSGNGLYTNTSIAPFNSGLVAGYHFDEGSGTTAIDVTGRNNGTLVNGPSWVDGKVSSYIFNTTVSIIKSLLDGIYTWFYSFADFVGTIKSSVNYTLIVDTIFPDYIFSSPTGGAIYNSSVFFNISTSDAPNASIIPNIDNSLVSWWRMDDVNSTGTKVIDYMNRNNGTAVGGATQVTDGRFGKAFGFDGVNDYINLSGSSFNFTNNMSLSVWVRFNEVGSTQSIIAKHESSGYFLTINDSGSVKFGVHNGTAYYMVGSNLAVSTGSWYYLSGVVESNTVKLYLDNVLQDEQKTFVGSIKTNNYPLCVGVNPGVSYMDYFNGSIDDVMIFNRSLSADEIASLYNATAYEHTETLSTQGNHTFNSYIQDFAGNVNTTGEVSFVVDTTLPNSTIVAPVNNTYTNSTNVTFTANLSDNIGIKNATVYVYNSSNDLVNETTTDYTSGTLTTTIGVVVELVEGIYNWFWKIFDWAGNEGVGTNSTLTIDTTYPLIEFNDEVNPENGSGTANAFNISATINETNIANVTVYFNYTNYVYDFEDNSSYFSNISVDLLQWNFSAAFGPLGPAEIIDYNVTIIDKAGQQNSTGTRVITGNQPPSLVSLTQTPSTNASLDPLTPVEINATLLDGQNNFESAWLQVTNDSSDWSNLIYNINMTNSGNLTNIILNASFQLPGYEGNISYRIFANDSVGGEVNLTEYNISNYWDCSWNISTTELEEVSEFFKDITLGNITIVNSGDSNYSGGCVVKYTPNYLSNSFSGSYYVSNFPSSIRIGFDSSYVVLLPNENHTFTITGGFPSSDEVLIETPIISIISNLTDSLANITTRYVNATMVVASGAVLYQDIEVPSSEVVSLPLRVQNISLSSYVRNLGGDGTDDNAALNVSTNWTIDSILASKVLVGNLTNNYTNLSTSTKEYNNLSLEFSSANLQSSAPLTTQIYSVKLYSYGYENSTGNLSLISYGTNVTLLEDTVNFTFYCEGDDTDDVCPSSCNYLTDTKCSVPSTDAGTSAGGSSGGGGGGAGGSFDKSSATFELVRGENQEFNLVFENKLASPKKNIAISISGENSEYVSVSPTTIDYVGANSKQNVAVKITAPSYFGAGQYLLKFVFKGIIQGNTTQDFTEEKYVTLRILDVSREKVNGSLSSMKKYISEMNASGFIVSDVEELYAKMLENYESINFGEVQNLFEQAKKIYEASFESSKMIEEMKGMVERAETNGLVVSETKKLLYLAEILFKRGDYVLALDKLKEAQLTYALETKGEFNIISAIKNNPGTSTGILVFALLTGVGSGYVFRLRLLKRRLKYLAEEEQLLLQLMKVVQRDCFENNKMSMEEYQEAMMQYEKGLNNVVADRIRTESVISNLMKLKGKRNALQQERDRLTMLVKQTQEDYLNRGKIDTRVYDNMLKTYAIRLSKIQEELVFMEAKDEIARVKNGVWYRLFKKTK